MGLRSEVGRNHRCMAKRTFDGPAPTIGWRRGYTGDTMQSGSTSASSFRWPSQGIRHAPVETYGSISYQCIKSSERTKLNFTEEHYQGASSLH